MRKTARRIDTFKLGRSLLLDWESELWARCPKKRGRSNVEWALAWHLGALSRRCREISTVLTPETYGAAAALTRTAVEIMFSASYIARAPKSRREHRALRFLKFWDVQSNAFVAWTTSLGLWNDKAGREVISEAARDSLAMFSELEGDLRSGWWGRRNRLANIVEEIADDNFIPLMGRAYMILSFFVHPTPLGFGMSLKRPKDNLNAAALLVTVEAAAYIALDALRMHATRKIEPVDFDALMQRHFPPTGRTSVA